MMKRSFIFIISALCLSASAQAQKIAPRYGFGGGLNLHTIDPDYQTVSRAGMLFYGFGELSLAWEIAVQGEVQYARKSFKDPDGVKYFFDYVNIPLMFKLYFSDTSSLDLGFQYGICANTDFPDTMTRRREETRSTKFNEYGFVFGLSGWASDHILLSMRIFTGMEAAKFTPQYQINSFNWEFTAGYAF